MLGIWETSFLEQVPHIEIIFSSTYIIYIQNYQKVQLKANVIRLELSLIAYDCF